MSSRELPVLWAITKGSFLNKLIILPLAFLLSAYLPKAVTVILVLGGLYLAYEGAEKIYEFFFHRHSKSTQISQKEESNIDVKAHEKQKIKSAIFTDFILSVEIVIIALGTVLDKPILTQIMVVSVVAIIATVGVYGIVALIVRMDDFGLRLITLSNGKNKLLKFIGNTLVHALPIVIKSLAIIGTIALLLVSGGIFSHKIDYLHNFIDTWPSILRDFILGLGIGIITFLMVSLFKYLYKSLKKR